MTGVAPASDAAVRARVAHAESLLARLEAGDTARAGECVEALVLLYGEALARVMARVAGTDAAAALVDDELVSHLLLVHGLHPVDVATRVARALDEVRPYLRSHGGDVELVSVRDGVARIRLQGSCRGCPSSSATLRSAVEEAIGRAAPDLDGVEADGAAPTSTSGARPPSTEARLPSAVWTSIGTLADLAPGALRVATVAGAPVLVLRVDGTAYAYERRCPECGHGLEDGRVAGGVIACGTCGRRYDVRLAGRCLDVPGLHLEPIPLLVGEGGTVRVAVAPAAAAA